MPKYHTIIPYRASDGKEAPDPDASDDWFGGLSDFRKEEINHNELKEYLNATKNSAVIAGTFSGRGFGGMYDNNTSDPLVSLHDGRHDNFSTTQPFHKTHKNFTRRYRTQFQQLKQRVPDETDEHLFENFRPEFCHEIGLKDLPSEVLSQTNAGNSIANGLEKIRNEGGWVFDQWFEVPHPWHYNTSDAFPILNLVNDMDVIFHLRPWQQWIQNWDQVQKLVDISMEPGKVDMLINYYDIPKQIWDDQFPLNRQMNHYAPDYQEHLEEFTVDVPVPDTTDINAHTYGWKGAGVEHTVNINTIDRVARYGILRLQGAEAVRNSTVALDFHSHDILNKAWLEVANEKLLTKVETDVDKTKKYIERAQHFKAR